MTAPVTVDRPSYNQAVETTRFQLAAYAAAVWAGLAGSFTAASLAQLVQLMVPAVQAGQMQMANLTSAYLAAVTGTEPQPVQDIVTQGRGVDPVIVYSRPIINTRALVAKGKPVDKALEAGGRRLESLVTTDLQMAKIQQADASLEAAGTTLYRRVPQGTETCAMCLIASTQAYKVGNLMPIHPGCDCDVDVIEDGEDLDDLLVVPDLISATHAKVEAITGISDRSGRAVDYRKLLINHEHGELGTVLTWRGQEFTSLADLKNQK